MKNSTISKFEKKTKLPVCSASLLSQTLWIQTQKVFSLVIHNYLFLADTCYVACIVSVCMLFSIIFVIFCTL